MHPHQPDFFGLPQAVHLPPITLRPRQRDRTETQHLAEQGADRAADKADRDNEGWKVAALSFFLKFGREHGGEFQTEDVRAAAVGHVATPFEARAWGHVAMKAKRLKQIEFVRPGIAKDPTRHGGFASVWRWIGERA